MLAELLEAPAPHERGRAKFLLSSIGTLGDLFPILELARELVERGQLCHMLGSVSGAAAAARLGVEYTVVAPTQTDNLAGKRAVFETSIFPSYAPTFRVFEREHAAGHRLIVVNRTNHSATCLMSERYGLPLCRVLLSPAQIRSLECPPMPWRKRARGRLGKSYRKYQLPKIYAALQRDAYVVAEINSHRASLGLRPIDSASEHEALITQYCAFFPEWFAARAADWPDLEFAGFPLPRTQGTLPEDIARLIERHGPPLVFTPGTGVLDVEQFFAAAKSCCELLDRPGVFLSPHLSAQGPQGARIVHASFVDLGVLLPHAALLVHHGGIGTTARALQAGIAQIISPQAYDQPDNGARVEDLGVGIVVPRATFTGSALAAAARALTESTRVASELRDLATRMARGSATASAADLLVRRFGDTLPLR